jgi:transcription elongation factor GreA
MTKYLSPAGLEKLKKELDYLRNTKRQEIAKTLEKCLAFGDLSENAEYHETKEAQAFMEGRILELENLIQDAVVVTKNNRSGFVQVGSTILVQTGQSKETFKVVGAEEANPLEGKISADSPLGHAILNQAKGAVILVNTPQGQAQYKILKVE